MGGGLLQLVAYGAQDAYICGNPQITFWKGLYKRHTNFAMEAFRVNFTGQASWGTKHSAVLGRHADLLYTTYLEVVMPGNVPTHAGNFNNDQGRLGYNLIKYVELNIGGQQIDRLYGEWLYLWDSLSSDLWTSKKLWNMVGGGPDITNVMTTTDSKTVFTDPNASCASGRNAMPNTLYIPLTFFYTRNPGAALPLIALQYHEVKIDLQWNDAQLIAGNFNNASLLGQPVQAAIYVDYIYLDVEERRRMAQQSHEYLIEQTQYNEDKGISSYTNRIDLTFNHPVKELVWVVQPTSYTNCKYSKMAGETRLKPFTYEGISTTGTSIEPVESQWIQINGQDRMDRRYGDYFNQVQMYQHHTGLGATVQSTTALPTHQTGIFMYSFALRPEEHQPSGTCNFSRIDTATIVMNMDGRLAIDESTDKTYDVRVYAVNYNILRIMSGMAGLAYSN